MRKEDPIFAAYLVIPAWLASAVLYAVLGKMMFSKATKA
jgi:hypothetical protein